MCVSPDFRIVSVVLAGESLYYLLKIETPLFWTRRQELRELATQNSHLQQLLALSKEVLKEMQEKWHDTISYFKTKFETELKQLMKSRELECTELTLS